jgi:polyhydroxyalkanoate synthesis regulator phasin
VIGEVKGDEASTILYFETRFTQLEEKVAKLRAAIEENQNKGSFLMKLIHLKESLYTSDALGDFKVLIAQLEEQEAFLSEIIQGNRTKNLEIKQSLIQEALAMQASTDWKDTTEKFKELKLRWIKTGPVEKEVHEEMEAEFNQAVDFFFEQRQHFYDGLALQAEENIKVYESLLQQARAAHDLPDAKMAFDISKRIQKEWKTAERFLQNGASLSGMNFQN